MAHIRTIGYCTASSLITYGAVEWGHQFANITGIPNLVIFYGAPGIALFLALHFSTGRPTSLGWQVLGCLAVVLGWYLAERTGEKFDVVMSGPLSLYAAGACSGAIGSTSLAVAMFPRQLVRAPTSLVSLIVLGAAIGMIGLPAGFLFGLDAGKDGDYLFLLFIPWQLAMGVWIARVARRI